MTHLKFLGLSDSCSICGTAQARIFKFCTQVHCVISYHKDHKPPLKGRYQGHVTHFSSITTRATLSGTAQATVSKFCVQVEYIKCLAFDDRLVPNGRGQYHVTVFSYFAPIISLELVKLGTSDFVC